MHYITRLFYVTVAISSLAEETQASQLIYTPVNPNFGGNPNNATMLLQEATDNNHFKGLVKYGTPPQTSQQLLESTITSSLYSQIASKIATDLGNGMTSGSFVVGNSTVYYSDSGTNTTITITNSGGSTTFSVPDGI